MPPSNDLPSASLALAAGISLIAAFLGLRQWYERRAEKSTCLKPIKPTSPARTCGESSAWPS